MATFLTQKGSWLQLLCSAALLASSACAAATLRPPDAAELTALEAAYQRNPDSPDAILKLASAYQMTGRAAEARNLLEDAAQKYPAEARLMLLLGTVREDLGDFSGARQLYEQYLTQGGSRAVSRQIARRMRLLEHREMLAEAKRLVAQEQSLATADPVPGTIAIYPFVYVGADPEYEPLGRALADLLTTDLSRTDRLRVLERSRVQMLLDEMRLTREGYVDPSTASRSGRLLRAERVVQGSLAGTEEEVELRAAVTDVGSVRSFGTIQERDALQRLFDAQRRLALGIYEELGIQLTPAELAGIGQVPTQSLEALIAYGSALAAEDRGDFAAAADLYRQAVRLDPTFNVATQRAERASEMERAESITTEMLAVAVAAEPVGIGDVPVEAAVFPEVVERPPAVETFDDVGFGKTGGLDIILRRPGPR